MSDSMTDGPRGRTVIVHTHILNDPDEFPDAVAIVQPSGVLLISHFGQDRQVPIKGYAPGAWLSFEHVGDYTAHSVRVEPPTPTEDRPSRLYVDTTQLLPPVPAEPPSRRRSPVVDREANPGPKAPAGAGSSPDAGFMPTFVEPRPRTRWRR